MKYDIKIHKHHVAAVVVGTLLVVGAGLLIQNDNVRAIRTGNSGTPAPTTSIVTDGHIPTNKSGLGFNAPWMYAVTHGPAGTAAELTKSAGYLNDPIIRFPGGTVARTYHINLPGYDGKQGGETQNYIIPFTNIFAPDNKPVARISFVVNLDDHFRHVNYHGSDEDMITDNLKTLTYLLDHGFKVPLVELGNEETATPELFWSFGNNPWKPIDTVQQNIQALVEIKLKYKLNPDYQRAHFKGGMDKYIGLLATYRDRINALMDSRGLPHPKYGVPIGPPSALIYSDATTWNRYYAERIRDDVPWMDALIPHYYSTITAGNPGIAATNLQKVIDSTKAFYGDRRLWFTEFSAGGGVTDDSADQITAFDQMLAVFKNPSNNTDYYFMHQYFTDGSEFGMIYKKLSANSKPVNRTAADGTALTNSAAASLKLFYSPRFCWSIKTLDTTGTKYQEAKDAYGCK
jgi:hypothetical protein